MATVRRALQLTWKITDVRPVKKDLQIVTSEASVTEGMYVIMIPVVGRALEGKTDRPSSITVLNKHEKYGYVYETPDKCDRVLEGPRR